ncbi:MAG: Bax inhibitor-1/YccA family protein [Chloroflexaceae bacterium]|nr:Bax inhibitor-1/YccA family protein [Chloroflexaceae bacterium]NJO05550.1 Bax inhibitor-1/YccA family protein [Chloroflexaceae bacterium]
MTQVYAWMMAGLLITGAVGLFVANNFFLFASIFSNTIFYIGLILVQLGVVVWISARIGSMAPALATTLFLLYSALTGLTFGVVFLVYEPAAIATTFFVTAGSFAGLSLLGYTTKRDLSGMGKFLFMALIGLLLASLVNFFFRNPALYWITTYAGVLIFAGLTVYDTQKIKNLVFQFQGDETNLQRVTILGALTLYLDFINLFLFLLRILGNRR